MKFELCEFLSKFDEIGFENSALLILFTNESGLTDVPFIAIPKCKCGPLTRPESPLSAIISPFFTFSPGKT